MGLRIPACVFLPACYRQGVTHCLHDPLHHHVQSHLSRYLSSHLRRSVNCHLYRSVNHLLHWHFRMTQQAVRSVRSVRSLPPSLLFVCGVFPFTARLATVHRLPTAVCRSPKMAVTKRAACILCSLCSHVAVSSCTVVLLGYSRASVMRACGRMPRHMLGGEAFGHASPFFTNSILHSRRAQHT